MIKLIFDYYRADLFGTIKQCSIFVILQKNKLNVKIYFWRVSMKKITEIHESYPTFAKLYLHIRVLKMTLSLHQK